MTTQNNQPEASPGITIDQHKHLHRCILTDLFGRDSIGRGVDDFDDMIVVDPYSGDPPSKRKDSELARVLSILNELEERGNG